MRSRLSDERAGLTRIHTSSSLPTHSVSWSGSARTVPGGRLIALVPRAGPGGWVYSMIKGLHGLHARAFGLHSFRQLAAQAGFRWTSHRTPFIHNFVAMMEAVPPGAPSRIASHP